MMHARTYVRFPSTLRELCDFLEEGGDFACVVTLQCPNLALAFSLFPKLLQARFKQALLLARPNSANTRGHLIPLAKNDQRIRQIAASALLRVVCINQCSTTQTLAAVYDVMFVSNYILRCFPCDTAAPLAPRLCCVVCDCI